VATIRPKPKPAADHEAQLHAEEVERDEHDRQPDVARAAIMRRYRKRG